MTIAVVACRSADSTGRSSSSVRRRAARSLECASRRRAEFLRWEVATATAGLLLDINPFDEPTCSKRRMQRACCWISTPGSSASVSRGTWQHEWRAPDVDSLPSRRSAAAQRMRFFSGEGGITSRLLAYALERGRKRCRCVRHRDSSTIGTATSLGYGPRYLHSTGQLHKGAHRTACSSSSPPTRQKISNSREPYSFGVLELAQALGDFESLERTDDAHSVRLQRDADQGSRGWRDRSLARTNLTADACDDRGHVVGRSLEIADRTTFCGYVFDRPWTAQHRREQLVRNGAVHAIAAQQQRITGTERTLRYGGSSSGLRPTTFVST